MWTSTRQCGASPRCARGSFKVDSIHKLTKMRVHKLLSICLIISCCVCASGKKTAATLQPVHVAENMRERAVHKSADVMRFRRAIEGKSMPSNGRNICESKFSGKCIDSRTETCDYPVPYDENRRLWLQSSAAE